MVPFLHYLDVMAPTPPNTITVVVLPEYVPRHWWDKILHNQKAHRIREALVGRANTVVADVPYGSDRLGPLDAGRPSDADPGDAPHAPSAKVEADAEPPRRRFGWRR